MIDPLSEKIDQEVRAVLGRHLKEDPANVKMDASLVDDLGIDSLGILEVTFEIQKKYKVKVPDEVLMRVLTGNDVVRELSRVVAANDDKFKKA